MKRSSGLSVVVVVVLSVFCIASGHNQFCKIHAAGGGGTQFKHVIVYGNGQGYATAAKSTQTPTVVLVNEPAQYYDALKSTRKLPEGSISLYNGSSRPEVGLGLLPNNPKSLKIYHDIPLTEPNAHSIHGNVTFDYKLFDKMLPKLEGYTKRLNDIGAVDLNLVDTKIKSVRQTVEEALALGTEEELIVIIGHNESGVMFFHDGSNLYTRNFRSKAQVWVVTCNRFVKPEIQGAGLSLSVTERINYATATRAAELIFESQKRNSSFQGMIYQLQNKFPVLPRDELQLPSGLKEQLFKAPEQPKQLLHFFALQTESGVEFSLAASEEALA